MIFDEKHFSNMDDDDDDDNTNDDIDNISILCTCGQTFVWTIGEQKFLANLAAEGKINEVKRPVRCPDCRAARRRNSPQY